MKAIAAILIATLISTSSFAGSTVCANEDLYFSNVQIDFGAQPPPGALISHSTVVYKSQTLERLENFQGLGAFSPSKFEVSIANQQILRSSGGPNSPVSEAIFTATIEIKKAQGPVGEDPAGQPSIGGPVVCRSASSMMP